MARGVDRAPNPDRSRGAVLSLLLLDTTVLISAERDLADLDDLIADDDDTAVAVVTIAELGVGVQLAQGRRRAVRRAFLADVLATVPAIPYDLSIARAHTQLLVEVRKSGHPRGAHDLIIAATALATRRILLTGDVRGFSGLPGLQLRSI